MFQPWFVELISILSNACVGLSALTVAIIGIIGLRQWRAELKGKTKFEIARKMALLLFQYRDEYKRARNPFTFLGESAERKKDDAETQGEVQLLDEYYARRNRLVPLQETLRKLYEVSWEAEVVLDKEIGKFIQPIEDSFKELFTSIEAYFQTQYNQLKRGGGPEEEWLKPHYKRIYGIDDESSEAIDNSTNALVEKLKVYLE